MAVTLNHAAIGTEGRTDKRSLAATILFCLLFTAWVGEWPLELDYVMYSGLWRSPFIVFGPMFEPLPGIRLFTWQVLLILMVPFCLAGRSSALDRAPELDRAIMVSALCVVITILWGWILGGSLYFTYYQVWRFLAALLLAYMLMSAIRSPRDLVTLGRIVVLSALIRGTLVIYFYWVHIRGKVFPTPEYMTNHDDSLLFVMAILIMGTWALIKGGKAAWVRATLVSFYLFYAMVLNDRRIVWVELVFAAAAIYFLIGPGPLRSRLHRVLVVMVPILLVAAVVAGSGGEGARSSPLAALTSVKSGDDPSSLTRQEELRNLLYTLSTNGNPLLGTGWGRPYEIVERIWSNYGEAWIMVPYTPHNSLVGLAVYAGLVGIFGIWGVVPVAAFLGALGYRTSTDDVPRVAAAVAVGTLVAFGVHCYGDIGLQSFACCTMFGAAMATAGKVAAWGGALSAVKSGASSPVGRHRVPGIARGVPHPANHAAPGRQRR